MILQCRPPLLDRSACFICVELTVEVKLSKPTLCSRNGQSLGTSGRPRRCAQQQRVHCSFYRYCGCYRGGSSSASCVLLLTHHGMLPYACIASCAKPTSPPVLLPPMLLQVTVLRQPGRLQLPSLYLAVTLTRWVLRMASRSSSVEPRGSACRLPEPPRRDADADALVDEQADTLAPNLDTNLRHQVGGFAARGGGTALHSAWCRGERGGTDLARRDDWRAQGCGSW